MRNYSDWRLLFLGGKLVLREGTATAATPEIKESSGWHLRSNEEGLTDYTPSISYGQGFATTWNSYCLPICQYIIYIIYYGNVP